MKKLFVPLMLLSMFLLFNKPAYAQVTDLNLAENSWGSGSITSDKDVMQFYFTIPKDGYVKVYWQSFMKVSTLCYLYDGDVAEKIHDRQVYGNGNTDAKNHNFEISLSPGKYCIVIKGYGIENASQGGTVRAKYEYEAYPTDEKEPNNGYAQAEILQAGQVRTGAYTYQDVADYYKINIPKDGEYDFNVTELIDDYMGKSNILTIFREDYTQAFKKQINYGELASTVQVPLQKGVHYVKLENYGSSYLFYAYKFSWKAHQEPVKNITISGKKEVTAGKTITLKAVVTPDDAFNKAVSWKSSNSKVIQIVSNGAGKAKIKGIKPGKATIKASATDGSGVIASYQVTVLPAKMNAPTLKSNKSGKVVVNWKKQTGVSGYRIGYKLKGSSYTRYKDVSKKKAKLTLTGLNSRKKYVITIQAYVKINGIKKYGKVSKAVSVKVK